MTDTQKYCVASIVNLVFLLACRYCFDKFYMEIDVFFKNAYIVAILLNSFLVAMLSILVVKGYACYANGFAIGSTALGFGFLGGYDVCTIITLMKDIENHYISDFWMRYIFPIFF